VIRFLIIKDPLRKQWSFRRFRCDDTRMVLKFIFFRGSEISGNWHMGEEEVHKPGLTKEE